MTEEEEVITSYIKFKLLKLSVGLLDTKKHDDKLREIAIESNQELDTQLKPFAESIPLEPGSVIFGQIQKTAIHYARSLWFNHIKQHDQEEKETTKYEAKLESLKDSLLADRNIRGEAVLVSADPRDIKLPIPAQVDTYILDGY